MKVSVNYAYARPHKLLASCKALESLAAIEGCFSALYRALAPCNVCPKALSRTTSPSRPAVSPLQPTMAPLPRCLALVAAANAFLLPASRTRHTLRRATGPVVLIGEDSFGDELASLGQSTATALSGLSVAVRGKDELRNVLKNVATNDVVHCTDSALTGKDWNLLEKDACPIWVRCVNEFGNDVVKEIFRNGKRRKRCLYEVAACAPYSAVLSTEERASWGGGAASIKRIVEFHRRERLSDDEVALEAGLDTFFVSLTFEDYELPETRQVLGCRRGVETELQPDAVAAMASSTRPSERPRASRESSFAPTPSIRAGSSRMTRA